MLSRRVSCLAAALLACAVPVRATSIATATVSGLGYSLTDLDPGDGLVPALLFAAATEVDGRYAYRYITRDNRAYDPAALPGGGVWGLTSALGAMDDALEVTGLYLPDSTGHSFQGSSETRLYAHFSIAPMSSVTLTASAALYASVLGGAMGDSAGADASLLVSVRPAPS